MKGDKRKDKRLEGLRAKAAAQMTPEEEREQRKLSIIQLEIILPTKEKEIKYMEKMLLDGKINFKDETMVDGVMPIYKIDSMIAQAKLQLEDFQRAYKETKVLIENDRTKEQDQTDTKQ